MNSKRVMVGDYKFGQEEKDIIIEILDSGRISEDRYVALFEKKFARIIGVNHCVLVNSGTSALIAALTALLYDNRFPKIKKGAKVITTPLTYIATSNAIKLVGMEPVFVDVNRETFDIIPDQVEAILKNSNPDEYALILPVHLMGYPSDMDALNAIAKKYDLITFEDTAQAHGSKYKGKNTGTFSLVADYSFYIAHNIQVGEMGAVITDDEELYLMIKKIKANGRMCDCKVCTRSKGVCSKEYIGSDPRFLHDMIGYNFKTMEFQAAMGVLQLKRFNEIIRKRQEHVKYLNDGLKVFSDRLILPKWDEAVSYLAYPIVIREDSGIDREVFRKKLDKLGVENRPLFGSIPTQQPAYSDYKDLYQNKLPNADFLGVNALYIGCHQYLEKEDLDYAIEAFYKVLK